MPSSSGPKISSPSNLVYCMDTYDTSNCVTPLGCGGWNGSTQGIKNILTGVTALYQNGLRISNRQFYTAFGISYPESAYGGAAASRQGLTPGYSVLSGGKTYDASRSLHLWVWDNNSNSWVPDSYFGGLRLAGHCYDNWAGAESGWQNQLNIFNANVATIKQAFPNSTWILCGSHACQMFDSTTIDNMVDLGAPRSTISSWTNGSAWREFVLVGTPGLGDNKAYGWAYENYSVNPSEVANMNLSVLPKTTGVLEFDGTDDYLGVGNLGNISDFTVEIVFKSDSVSNYRNPMDCNWLVYSPSYSNIGPRLEQNSAGTLGWVIGDSVGNYTGINVVSSGLNGSLYHYAALTRSSSYFISYYNGTQAATTTFNNWYGAMSNLNIGRGFSTSSERWFIGKIPIVKIYNTVLSPSQIQQNYLQYKTRFNFS